MKHIKIDDNMYGQTLHVIVNCSMKQFQELVYRHTKFKVNDISESDDASYYTIINKDHDTFSFIYMSKFDHSTERISVLIHEIYHHVHRSLKYVGINNEEATSYYLQYFVFESLNRLYKEG